MRYIIVCSFFLAIISGCTLEVAREAGKAIKSIDTTFSSGKTEKANKKQSVFFHIVKCENNHQQTETTCGRVNRPVKKL